ncbi:hypothetical protein LCGC14_0852620 [marine sediment metagenome]|uniref:Uncharacterized protein n=1 Tax=marine sediment metagenome TaxID=412755 RepID=A0A0F9PV42_9ZZZZ
MKSYMGLCGSAFCILLFSFGEFQEIILLKIAGFAALSAIVAGFFDGLRERDLNQRSNK